MTQRSCPTDVIHQARRVLDAWNQIDNQLTIGKLTIAALVMEINQARVVDEQITSLKNQLTDLRNQRQALHLSTWDKIKRLRAAIKGIYGDDSSQYEMVGGTRVSERKKPSRKIPTPV